MLRQFKMKRGPENLGRINRIHGTHFKGIPKSSNPILLIPSKNLFCICALCVLCG
jgi:hypothetical protein